MSNCPIVNNTNLPNTYYGPRGSGDVGEVYRNRSFGGAMSNRKFTRQQVIPHKLQPKEIREGEVSINLNDNKPERYMSPLIPRILGSTENPEYRSGYMSNLDYVEIPENNNYTQYFFPMQELQKMKFKDEDNINNNNNKNYQEVIHTINGLPIEKIKDDDVKGDYIKYPFNDEPYKFLDYRYKHPDMIVESFSNFANVSNNYNEINSPDNFVNSTLKFRECIEKENNRPTNDPIVEQFKTEDRLTNDNEIKKEKYKQDNLMMYVILIIFLYIIFSF